MKIDTAKLLSAKQLLDELFPGDHRPCLRTLRTWQKKRIIPYYKIGQLVLFDPDKVRAALARKNYVSAV